MKTKVLAAISVVLAVLGFAAPAFATGYDATSATTDITSLITNNIPAVALLVVTVCGLLVGFYLLQWGVRTVMNKIRRGIHV